MLIFLLSSDQVLAGVDPNTSYSEDLLPQLILEAEEDIQLLGKCIIYSEILILNTYYNVCSNLLIV